MRLLGHTARRLARLQVELEYELTPDGLIIPIEGSEERNRCCLYVSECCVDAFFRIDVPAVSRDAVARLERGEILAAPELLAARLGGRAVNRFETYVAPAPLRVTSGPRALLVDARFVVAAADDRPASSAWSVRESDHAAECAVETIDRFRRRGFASAAASAWVNAVLAAGKVPFYSHDVANDASRALAARLGLTHVFTVVGVE